MEGKENVKGKTVTIGIHILYSICMLKISDEEKGKTQNNTLFAY